MARDLVELLSPFTPEERAAAQAACDRREGSWCWYESTVAGLNGLAEQYVLKWGIERGLVDPAWLS